MGKFRKYASWTLVILWMALIFFLSSQPGEQSGNASKIIIDWFRNLGIDLLNLFGEYTSYVIRKTAHFTEFFILCLLFNNALFHYPDKKQKRWHAFLAAALYSITDEIHQAFVPKRVATPVDVFIDLAGIGLATLLSWTFRRRMNNRGKS